jgi:hypothetical protein
MATYTQIRSWPFWLMIVSIAVAVLPVWRSPRISSRWPRPMGIMESMALIGLDRGVHRLADDDARGDPLDRPELVGFDGSLPVQRVPSGSTARPISASPTGT